MNIKNVKVYEIEETMRACKFPMSTDVDKIEVDDKRLKSLSKCGSSEGHDNALSGILVAFDLTCSNKMWVEFERYHFAQIVSCQSTMHRITSLKLDDCLNEYVDEDIKNKLKQMVKEYNEEKEYFHDNRYRVNDEDYNYLQDKLKEDYLKILYSTPSGLELTARITTNYRQLKTMYKQRKNHRLPEWRKFCKWIEELPHSELIVGVKC